MSSPDQAAQATAREQAHALARELRRRGFTATVVRTRGHQRHPCVHIAARRGWHRTEYIYAAPADDGWWFWWSCLDAIAPVSDLTAAAETITRVLTPAQATYHPAQTALPVPVMVPVFPARPRPASTERTSHAS
jgi:hypothetical protein